MKRFFIPLLVMMAWPAWADMYPDASNAKLPDARTNLGAVPHVATNALLAAAGTAAYPQGVWRNDFAAGNGAPPLFYKPSGACSLNAGAGDNGSQVKSADSKCWLAVFSSAPDLREWGAIADDSTDIGAFMQRAYNAVGSACIRIPAGIYRITTQFLVFHTANPCFFGDGWNEATVPSGQPPFTGAKTGTWIHITDTTLQPFSIQGIDGQGGSGGFSNMAFFEDQPAPGVGFTPNAYKIIFDLVSNGGRVDLTNLFFLNTTQCIHFDGTTRSHVKIAGQPLGTCILVEHVGDTLYFDSIDFKTYWSADPNVGAYTQANVDPFIFKRADSPFISDYFSLMYHSGIKFDISTTGLTGPTTGAQIANLNLDGCVYCIWVTGAGTQLQIANARTAAGAAAGGILPGSNGYLDQGGGVVSIANFDCYNAGSNCMSVTGGGAVLVGTSLLWSYNWDNNGSAGFNAGANGVIKAANAPHIVNPQHGAGALPASPPTTARYVMPITQFWTPTLATTNSNGTFTYTYHNGEFWFDGSKLTVNFKISATVAGSPTGSMLVGGLPLSGYNLAPNSDTTCAIGVMAGIRLTAGYTSMAGLLPGGVGASQLQLVESSPTADTITLPASAFTPSIVVQGSCIIQTGN